MRGQETERGQPSPLRAYARDAHGDFCAHGVYFGMSAPTKNEGLARLAAKYVWSTAPEIVVSDGLRSLVARVMELGTWEDAGDLLAMTGADIFLDVLKSPPAGVLSDKSLAFWHYRLGGEGPPPRSRRRFN